jgi:L-malate glycosyltransferase
LRVGIYNEPGGGGVGGAENMVAVLAEAISAEHQVEIVHHTPTLTAGRLTLSSGADLSAVRLRYVERDTHDPTPYHRSPRRRCAAARSWHAELSAPYDLFVAVLHGLPPFCHAPAGALVVLFPFHRAPYVAPPPEILALPWLRRLAEHLYQRWEWKSRLRTYQVRTAISDFSRVWTRRRWGIDCTVVPPPVDVGFAGAEKEPIILSVGRFALEGEGHTKKQEEMLGAFSRMKGAGLLDGWTYHSVGGLRDTHAHRVFFEGLQRVAARVGARVVADLGRAELRRLYERASIFWHAAGYGQDETGRPEMAEHFGISTVEAMAAGCVPVVPDKGGQRELVSHGRDGFLWGTLQELEHYTRLLAEDPQLRNNMAEAARARAQRFSRDVVVGEFLDLLRPALSRARPSVRPGGPESGVG